MAKLYTVEGEIKKVEPANGNYFTLEELQTLVGGYFEIVRTPNPKTIAVVDDEGMIKRKPANMRASAKVGRLLVGDVLMCDRRQVQ